jgi:hypothetical integral membrane protein (TIGR02206 family)
LALDYFFSTAINPDHPFVLFGVSHLLVVLWVIFFGWIVIRTGMKANEKRRNYIRRVLIVLFLIWEVEWQAWHLITDTWSLQDTLPLHLCSIMIWFSIYGLWKRKRWTFTLMYFFGIAGAIQAVITPDATYAFPHVRFLNTMFSHSLLVTSGFWVVFVEGYRPRMKDLWGAFAAINGYAVVMIFVNQALGSKYLYMGQKPETASLLDFFPPWPFYFPILEAILLLVMVGMYLPFRKSEGKRRELSPSE